MQNHVTYSGRSVNLSTSAIENFIVSLTNIHDDTFRRYPEVLGGISGAYLDFFYERHDVSSISNLVQSISSNQAKQIYCIGSVEDVNIRFSLLIDSVEKTSSLEITTETDNLMSNEYKDSILAEFDKLFPYAPYNRVDRFLLQRGFLFKSNRSEVSIPRYRSMESTSARQKLRAELGPNKYGYMFENYCAGIAEHELLWDVSMSVKLESEGTGGDYDVLALSEASNDLIYIEAKSGTNLDQKDFKNIINRHNFLKPAYTIIAIDLSKQYTNAKEELFFRAIAEDYAPGHVPAYERVTGCRSTIISAHRNIFLVSNEDLRRAFALCMRYYDGVIRQTAYYS